MKHTQEIIIKNSIKCLECNKVLVSRHTHDYKTCSCENQAMVDGGHDYLRRGAKDLNKLEELSITKTEPVGCTKDDRGKCWRCENESHRN